MVTILLGLALPALAGAQDTTRTYTLPAETVSVTRITLPLAKIPLAVQTLDKRAISLARPTWGLDEALASVPGVHVANRYNFSVDQRLSIRGFGARSAFAVRGIKILIDGIPQTLPDGQGQLTNLDLAAADRIEVLRGSSSALFGNAAGGVISIWTNQTVPTRLAEELRVVGGAFDRELRRTWTKWQGTIRFPIGGGSASVSASRLRYEGERDHSAADLRNLNARLQIPVAAAWTLSLSADAADDPRADNPGALTRAELRANRDSAAPFNILRLAGKDVRQAESGVTLKGQWRNDGEATLTVFGLARELTNPLPQAFITLGRRASGLRVSASRPARAFGHTARLTAGADLQWQRDDRREYSYIVPNAALTAPNNTTDSLIRNQLERVAEVGPFLQATVDLSSRWSLTGGLRYDRVRFRVTDRLLSDGVDNSGSRVFAAASGSVGIAFNPSPSVTVYANTGSSFETPTTTELNNQPPPGGGGFNPDLRPQRAWSYEVGGRGAAGRLSWNLALFQADVTDELIGFEDSLVPGRRYFRNAARARHRGAELGAGVDLGAGLQLAASWTISGYYYTAYRIDTLDLAGKAMPGIPRHWLRLTLSARPGFARGAWAELETTHSSGFFVDDTLGTRTSPWWTTNLRAGWDRTIGGVGVSPFVGLNNAFNRKYVGSVVINAARRRYYEPAPGRNLYLGLSLHTR
ncbi:MAG: TonB-dependent receptor [Gemmatimonadetes bacterium]|nr:TonB-dependent receptor [Gemmatimonadota bacterium]